MDRTRRILVFEFISAGGLGEAAADACSGRSDQPEPLLAQGARMRDALLAELLDLPAMEVVVADGGLVSLPHSGPTPLKVSAPRRLRVLPTPTGGDLVQWLRAAAADVDLVWAIAPETDTILLRLCEAVPPAHWIGCSAAAIRIASSKTRTREHLAAHGLPTPPAWSPGQPTPGDWRRVGTGLAHGGRWVLKPDDGAGGERTQVLPSFDTARAALETASATVDTARASQGAVAARQGAVAARQGAVAARQGAAAEPQGTADASGAPCHAPRWALEAWIEGEALSLSLLCAAGRAEVLSVNRQRVSVAEDGQLVYAGVDTAVEPVTPALRDLAERCAAAVPGLAGFVGIDLVRRSDGGLCVIEINPRLTCAYAGLVGTTRESADERSQAPRVRNLSADIIAAHDAALATHAIDTADARPEHS